MRMLLKKLSVMSATAALVVVSAFGLGPIETSLAQAYFDINVRITELTGLDRNEIDGMYAVEQRADMVLIASDITIPIVLEPKLGYLLIRVAATGEWIRVLIDGAEWASDFLPALEQLGVEINQQPAGTIDALTPAAEAAQLATTASMSAEEVADLVRGGVPGSGTNPPAPVGGSDTFGRTAGSMGVSSSGEATYTLPIFVPRGAGGLQPELALAYGHRQHEGIAGVGWGVSGLSAITRCAKTRAQDGAPDSVQLERDDRYCLDGNQLRHVGGAYGYANSTYRTEVDLVARITAQGSAGNGPAWFKVESKDGLIYEYGNSADSRIETLRLNYESTVRTWALTSISDRFGNQVNYHYEEDGPPFGDFRIDYINYMGNQFRVEFQYATQPADDVDVGYGAGGLIEDEKRLEHIDVKSLAVGSQGGGYHEVVRRYAIGYDSTLSSASRSRVSSITECAGNPLVCRSPTQFDYQDGTSDFGPEIQSGTLPSGTEPLVLDVNGDGRTDLVYPSSATSGNWMYRLATVTGDLGAAINSGISSANHEHAIGLDYDADGIEDILVPTSGGTWWAILGSATGLSSATNTNTPLDSTPGNATSIDMNGDGREDLVYGEGISFIGTESGVNFYSGQVYVRHRTLTGFEATPTLLAETPQVIFPQTRIFSDASRQSRHPDFDVNGDGYKDLAIYHVVVNFNGISHKVKFILGGGVGEMTLHMGYPGGGGLPFDINGDGYTDVVSAHGNNLVYQISSGPSFNGIRSGASAPGVMLSDVVTMDWDGDGHEDLVYKILGSNNWQVARSDGYDLEASIDTGLSNSTVDTVLPMDVNGDGMIDLGYTTTSGTFAYRLHTGVKPDLLTSVTDGHDNTVSIEYLPISNDSVYTRYYDAQLPSQDYQGPTYVVDRITQSDGVGGEFSRIYRYFGAQRDLEGRGLSGFDRRDITDNRDGTRLTEHYHRDWPYRGRTRTSELYLDDGTLVRRNDYVWDSVSGGTGFQTFQYPYVSQYSETIYEAGGPFNGNALTTTTVTTQVDSLGTPTEVRRVVEELSSANGLEPGSTYTELLVAEPTGYPLLNNLSTWCIGRPQRTELTHYSGSSQGSITRTRAFAWNTSQCRVDSVTVEPGTNYEVVSAFGYDGAGNVETETVTGVGMAPRVTQTDWGVFDVYPQNVTNAEGEETVYARDIATGDLTSVTDPNGVAIQWEHDLFGNVNREIRPDGTQVRFVLKDCTNANAYCGTHFDRVKTRLYASTETASGGQIRFDETYADSFDRTVQSSEQSLSGKVANVRTIYDRFGRVYQRSAPDFAFLPQFYSTFVYDEVGRTVQIMEPVNDSSSSLQYTFIDYEGLSTRVTDPESKVSTRVINSRGQLRRSTDHDGYYQQFDYDSFGSVLQVTDSLSNTLLSATYEYGIGAFRRTSNDMDLGSWTYTPNALGEVVAFTDAKNQSFSATFDRVGRPKTRTEAEGTTTWTWGDSIASHDVGKLRSVVMSAVPSHSQSFEYDSLGRLSKHTTTSDATYEIDYAYNTTTGYLESIEYPESTSSYRFKVLQEYEAGILKRVRRSDGPQTTYWEAESADSFGNVTRVALGNGVDTVRSYDSATGRLESIRSGPSGSGSLQNMSYLWDRVGNLTKRHDLNRGLDERFFYDNLHRLDSSSLNGTTNLSLDYDLMGNILSKSSVGPGQWGYHPSKKHAVTSAGSATYEYDANGNMDLRDGDSISWSSYNYPTRIQEGAREYEYSYDSDREKWRQIYTDGATTETTIYVAGIFEKNVSSSGTEYRHYVNVGRQSHAIHVREAGGATYDRYLLHNHQESIAAILDNSGSALVYENFSAFGERRDPTDWDGPPSIADENVIADTTDLGYTGHLSLEQSSLVHMRGRVFDTKLGRALSADPFVTSPSRTQYFNRYAYVYNNPLKYTDPSGFCGDCGIVVTFSFIQSLAYFDLGGSTPPPPDWCKEGKPAGCYGAASALDDGIVVTDAHSLPMQSEDPWHSGMVADGAQLVAGLAPGGDALYELGVNGDAQAALESAGLEIAMTATGAAIGAFAGGVGAVPGAAIGYASAKVVRVSRATARFFRRVFGKCCFVAGTLVAASAGLVPIESIAVGDEVWARDPQTGETALKAVTDLITRHEREIWEVEIRHEDGTVEVFETTDDHPWWVESEGWVETADLKAGQLAETQSNDASTIVRVELTTRVEATYNLTVADFETYFVGSNRVLVHNCKIPNSVKELPLKDSPFGRKLSLSDEQLQSGAPGHFSRDQIEDAIIDAKTSIASRRSELAVFDAAGGGSATKRLAHARRISLEEDFLRSLEKARGR